MINNEFQFYTAYQTFKRMAEEGILTQEEFNQIIDKLIHRYQPPLSLLILDKA